jgi:outer membrane receptor for ferrienterochelin and colicins
MRPSSPRRAGRKARLALLLLCLALCAHAQEGGAGTGDETGWDETEWDESEWDETEIHYAGEITVTGTRTEKRLTDSPVATEIISAEDIENSSAATLSQVLDDYGLMYSSNPMGDYIQLQGLGESRVLFLVDGKRIPGRIAGRVNGDTLPLDNVERIEIVRGPQSALYGSDGIGGVVNIITRKPGDAFSLSATLSNTGLLSYDDPSTETAVSPFASPAPFREQRASLRLGLPTGPARNTLSLDAARGGFYFDEGSRTSILPRYWQGKVSVDSAFDPADSLAARLGASFMYLQSDQQIAPSGSLARSGYIRAEGSADLDFFAGDALLLSFRLYDNYYQRDRSAYYAVEKKWENTGQFENENLLSLEASAAWYGPDRWALTWGLEASLNSMEKFNLADPVTLVNREALFVQAEYYREGTYSVLGGFRLERNSQFGLAAAPKLSAMYRFTRGFRVLGSAGLGYRAPGFNDLYLVKDDPPHPLVLGNPELRPEYAANGSLGLDYTGGRYFFSLNGYYTELFDEIAYVNANRVERGMTVYDTKNISRSLRTGADMEGKVSFLACAYVSAGYSYVFAWDRKARAELHPQPAHTVKVKLGLDTGKPWNPGEQAEAGGHAETRRKKPAFLAWAAGRFFSPLYHPGGSGYASRLILDAYAAVSFLSHFKVYLSADNLLGTIDQFLGPSTAQSFTLGLQYTY